MIMCNILSYFKPGRLFLFIGCFINEIKLFYYIYKSYLYQFFIQNLIISSLFLPFSPILFFHTLQPRLSSELVSVSPFQALIWALPSFSHPINLMIKEICHKIKFYGYQSVWFRLKNLMRHGGMPSFYYLLKFKSNSSRLRTSS